MNDFCSQCKLPIEASWYFCPNCGNPLKEKPPVLSAAKQTTIYLVSFFLAPLGLYWAMKYIKYKDNKTRTVGIVSLVLTVVAIAISIFGVKYALDQYSRFLNSISPYGF